MLLFVGFFAVSQSVYIDWQQCFGGTDIDGGLSIKALDNGHLIILSFTSSDDIDVSYNHGESDFWLFETDEFGNLLWEKSFGGSDDDLPVEIMLSTDGGFILFGETWSNDGDVSGNHGGLDYWLVKTDSLGNLLWQHCLGSSMNNIPSDMDMDDDGNIYVIGLSLGVGGDVTANNGSYDYWFLKINSLGEIVWDNNLGGAFGDFGMCIATTPDGGVIVGGLTDNGDVFCNTEPFNATAWLIKLDSANSIEWQQCYGGSYTENIIDLKTTNDGGYILLGLTNSNDGDVSGFHGQPGGPPYNFDIWVLKVDSIGGIEWQRCLGGTGNDNPDFIKLTPEGNYIVGGRTNSNNGDVSGNHSIGEYFDQWIVKLNPQGTILWQQCIGSSWDNALHDASVLSESEIIIIGSTPENNDGDVSCDFKGDGDAWVYKLIDTTVSITESELFNTEIKVYPNPANTLLNIDFPYDYKIQNTTIEILDINGKIVLSTQPLSVAIQLSIKKLNKGIYLVKIQNDRAFITRKIIIQ